VTLGRSPSRRRGSGGGKPARWTPGQWGTSVWCSGVDGRDERCAEEKKIRSAGSGSVLKGSDGEGARTGGRARDSATAWCRAAAARPWRARAVSLPCYSEAVGVALIGGAGNTVRPIRFFKPNQIYYKRIQICPKFLTDKKGAFPCSKKFI
jgi:hypothetical protein